MGEDKISIKFGRWKVEAQEMTFTPKKTEP
jgi:hypothetical protein